MVELENRGGNYPQIHALKYEASVERPEKDEAETIQAMLDTLRSIREKTFVDSGHPMRSVHVKSHGLLKGELEVLPNLPDALAQGVFSGPASYPLLMRLSSTPGDMLPDSVSVPRGLAMKILGVKGPRLLGPDEASSQDFIMVNGGTTFQAKDAKAFLKSLKLLAPTTDRVEGLKVAVSTVLKGAEKVIESAGGSSAAIRGLGGEPEKHILGESFFTQTPSRYGDYMAKLSLVPISDDLKALKDSPLKAGNNPTAIRDAVLAFFREHGGVWELRVQLCVDSEQMPIEDASKSWPEDISPYLAVARVTILPQVAWSEARSKAMDDGMSFSPWRGLEAHRPLGSIQRARKPAYQRSAEFRAARGTPITEPRTLDEIPD